MKLGKKFLAIGLSVLMVTVFAACSNNKPETPTQSFNNAITALKTLDTKGVKKYFGDSMAQQITQFTAQYKQVGGDEAAAKQLVQKILSKLNMEVTKETIDNNTATLDLSVTFIDFTPLLTNYMQQITAYQSANASATQAQIITKSIEIFNSLLDQAQPKDPVTTQVKMTKSGNIWQITDTSFMDNVMQ